MSEPITILIDVKDKNKATEKAKEFFSKQKIKYTEDSFENDKWAGRYRFLEEWVSGKGFAKTQLEITFTDRPWWAKQPVIEPEIQAFFAGDLI